MSVNTKEPQLIQKPVGLSEQRRTSLADFDRPGQRMTQITLLAHQIKQLKHSRKTRQNRRRIAHRVIRKAWDAGDGSLTRTMVLAAIFFTAMGLITFIRNPGSSPREVGSSVHSGIDLVAPEERLPDNDISLIDLEFIKRLEGFHSTPYYDGTQKSWGYGTKAGRGSITREQAEEEMKAYLQKHCLPILPAGLPTHKATAMASFCYNLGPDQAKQTDLWKAVYSGGAVNFLGYTRSVRGADLLPRRRKEQAMWDGQHLRLGVSQRKLNNAANQPNGPSN